MAEKIERREYTCPVWVCGWHIAVAGPLTDAEWRLALQQHTEAKCAKRAAELGRLGTEQAERNGF